MQEPKEHRGAQRSVREESRELFRREILKAATQVFEELGYQRARIADIAGRAGVATGTVYNYFESKDAIFQHILRQGIEQLTSLVAQANEKGAPLDRLNATIDAVMRFLEERGALYSIYLQQSAEGFFGRTGMPDVEAEFSESFHPLLRGILEEAAAAGELRRDIDTDAMLIMLEGGLNGVVTTWAAGGCKPGLTAQAATAREIFLEGVLTR
jgi:AcrR family transcriptional regulator